MKATVKASIIALMIMVTGVSVSAQFNQRNARDFISKTSYIIGEAYDIVYYYGFYSSGYLSKAVNHQNYAKYLYNVRDYRYAVYHSDLARSYALRVIYDCNNYWDNYYRPYYYSSPRPPYTNNRPPQNSHYYGYNQGRNVQYGHRSSTSVAAVNNASNSRVSKYTSSGNTLKSVEFETWDRSYYSSEERSLLGGSSAPSTRELESVVANSTNIRRVSNDNDVVRDNGIRDFSSDIDTYRRSNTEEARTISISRPSDFGTTPEVTRSTANTSNPINTRQSQPAQNQPVQTRQTTTQPVQSRETTTQPAQSRQTTTTPSSSQTRQTNTQPTSTTTRTSTSETTPSNRSSQEVQTNQSSSRSSSSTTNQNTNTNTRR